MSQSNRVFKRTDGYQKMIHAGETNILIFINFNLRG